MAGSIVITHTQEGQYGIERVSLAWTSTAGGAVSDILTGILHGILTNVEFIPGSGGTQPSAAYDITLLDANLVDVLAGRGANLSNTTGKRITPASERHDGTTAGLGDVVVSEPLQLVVANAGDSKTGTVVLYLRH